MEAYDEQWADNYLRLANASIAGREGLYRLCAASFADLPEQARILVVGCGTGEELVTLAKALPMAAFVAIDPAEPMLDVCRKRIETEKLADRVTMHCSTLEDFHSTGLFDAATAILVSQHLHPDDKVAAFFQYLFNKLKPGGSLYGADMSYAMGWNRNLVKQLWLNHVIGACVEPDRASAMLDKIESEIRPREESVILQFIKQAGFKNVMSPFRSLFYAAWVATKKDKEQV